MVIMQTIILLLIIIIILATVLKKKLIQDDDDDCGCVTTRDDDDDVVDYKDQITVHEKYQNRFTDDEVNKVKEVIFTDDEVNKVMEEMQTTIKEMEESEYYHHTVKHFRNNKKIRNSILRVLGSGDDCHNKEEKKEHGHLQIVMYGVGSPQFNYRSQYQLSLAILLKRDLSHWIEAVTIQFFDPCITPVDIKVMESLGCKVLNKEEKYPVVEKPTLFFMPCVSLQVLHNLVVANWCPSRLNKMMLFTHSSVGFFGKGMKTISRHTIKFNCIRCCKTGLRFYKEEFESSSPFHRQCWWFFNLPISDANQLEAAILPPEGTDLLERVKGILNDHMHGKDEFVYMDSSYIDRFLRDDETLELHMEKKPFTVKDWATRYPNRPAKRNWCPPSTGWIKLNFSAVAVAVAGNDKVVLGYGGIFHNENKECLLNYSCPSPNDEKEGGASAVDDLNFAYAKALKEGLRLYMELRSTTLMDDGLKLLIEGDCVSIVRWVNGIFPPPKRLVGIVGEIHDLMSSMNDWRVIFHIYKEANSMAIDLAYKGAHS